MRLELIQSGNALGDSPGERVHFCGRESTRPKTVTDLIRRKMPELATNPACIIDGNVFG